MDFNASMLALAAFLGTGIVGFAVLHGLRSSALYISAEGNPRNRGTAFGSIVDIIKGLLIAAFFLFGGGAVLWGMLNH